MFDLEVNLLDSELITARVKLLESRDIHIGIKNKNRKAAIADDLGEGTRSLPNYSKGMQVRKIKGRDNDYTTAEQLADLESWGLLSEAATDENNRDLIDIMSALNDLFIKGETNRDLERRVLNAARALIRNRIIEKRLGSNSLKTIKNKGFDLPLIDTGDLFTNINSWFKEKDK